MKKPYAASACYAAQMHCALRGAVFAAPMQDCRYARGNLAKFGARGAVHVVSEYALRLWDWATRRVLQPSLVPCTTSVPCPERLPELTGSHYFLCSCACRLVLTGTLVNGLSRGH